THINTVIQQRPYVRTHNIAQIFVGIVMASIITSIIMLSIKGARVSRNKSQNVMNVCKDIFICLGVTAGIVILSSLFMLLANAISMSSHDIELKASVNSFVSPVDTAPPPPFVSSGADSSVAPPPSYVEAMQIGKAEAMQIGKGG
ncbi:MAG: hypothetical protein OEZ01_18125, partial [Candidatus Heimdallarchaeota archaeon]|nr:hypothetical protein [Candidatus Heimdallarchaeota archaeon]